MDTISASTASNGRRATLKRTTRRIRKRSLASRAQISTLALSLSTTPRKAAQRVFLYIQLNEVIKLPETPYSLEMHLYQSKNTLQKMQERYTTETIIYQNEFDMKKPVFALGILQDSIDDMNTFSDNPLIITLYQRIPRHRKGELKTIADMKIEPSTKFKREVPSEIGDSVDRKSAEPQTRETISSAMEPGIIKELLTEVSMSTSAVLKEAVDDEGGEGELAPFVNERLELISRGHCDLLKLFHRKRFISNMDVLLYPQYQYKLESLTAEKITTTTIWHMYSILPMLKKFTFTNLAFITLESIYNAPMDMHDRAASLGICLSFRSTQPDENGSYKVVPFCNYYGFTSNIISDQSTNVVWETIKRDCNLTDTFSFNQMDTGSRIKLPRLFNHLLYTENVDFKIPDIDPVLDLALVNNSLHRYVIDSEMRAILEAAVVHNHFELLVQVYNESPQTIIYEGTINLSVFGYPNVNSVRFATVLTPVVSRSSKQKSRGPSLLPSLTYPMFTIIKICFFQPIAKYNEPLDVFNESEMKYAKLRRCFDIEFLKEEDDRDIAKELYRAFDDLISDIIATIVKRDIHDITQRRDYFCCQLGNLINLLLKICGADFNVRMRTKTNIEFREMLTHMYKELVQRMYDLLMACGRESLSNCIVNYEAEQVRLIRMLEEYRFMQIVGDTDMAQLAFEELKVNSTNKMIFEFYLFLNDVETLNFESASKYLVQAKDNEWEGDYFASLLKLYIDYQMEMESEELAGEAYANLIEQLRIFTTKNSLDQDAWILLYCYYKNNQYMPGMEYTRWKYENLYDIPRKNMSLAPRSFFELYMPIDCELKTPRAIKFYKIFKLFARLGAYGFAEVVFAEVANDCPAVEAYLVTTTLKMLQGHIDNTFKVRTFPTDNSIRGKMLRYYLAHINGSVEYARGRYDEAINQYKQLLSITEPDILLNFYLSLSRLGQLSFNRGDYPLAKKAFAMCLGLDGWEKQFSANYGMGRSLYYMNQLEDAIEYLANCTHAEYFVPDVWGYLAVINLRLNKTKRALDCWKMAKQYPEMAIADSIYDELNKIKFSDISLLVDDDGNEDEFMGKMDFGI
ncbi:uncharacterized protein LOC115630527 [Scaptodrosophila lebanonensis]|uniref:Uncharacterized protein LOC115630527 n=1 Tax=Drosophila lebanonensis TaxID=7225 RepID=A0A6J2U4X6_DROLE|nr:uncharacterized protein LOC115630527 [Scaptodrosophila lebanonensis]